MKINFRQIRNKILVYHPSLFLILMILYVKFKLSLIAPHFCLFEKFIKIHCPLCGTTKSIQLILNGQLESSINVSIVGIAFLFYLPFLQFFLLTKKYNHIYKIEIILTFLLFFNFIKQNYGSNFLSSM